ncbi:hypothetical protein BDV11DRAFT_81462 [Aspergillus similis]
MGFSSQAQVEDTREEEQDEGAKDKDHDARKDTEQFWRNGKAEVEDEGDEDEPAAQDVEAQLTHPRLRLTLISLTPRFSSVLGRVCVLEVRKLHSMKGTARSEDDGGCSTRRILDFEVDFEVVVAGRCEGVEGLFRAVQRGEIAVGVLVV